MNRFHYSILQGAFLIGEMARDVHCIPEIHRQDLRPTAKLSSSIRTKGAIKKRKSQNPEVAFSHRNKNESH